MEEIFFVVLVFVFLVFVPIRIFARSGVVKEVVAMVTVFEGPVVVVRAVALVRLSSCGEKKLPIHFWA